MGFGGKLWSVLPADRENKLRRKSYITGTPIARWLFNCHGKSGFYRSNKTLRGARTVTASEITKKRMVRTRNA